ncbi:MAG: alpha/beta fold hydrolase [Candidatus Eiseniibacteriota bacterium]
MNGARFVSIPGGRRLAYAEYGDPGGFPVVAAHGNPGSRLAWAPLGRSDLRGFRLIAPDRPGFGGSEGGTPRSHGDWAGSVAALADALGLGRFALVGVSGGGPWALAAAAKLAARVEALGLIATGPSPERTAGPFLLAARHVPALIRVRAEVLARLAARDPHALVRRTFAGYPEVDRALLRRPEVAAHLAADFAEAYRQGGAASAREMTLFARRWSTAPAEATMPVILWHGLADTVIPLRAAEALAARLPRAKLVKVRGAGHLWWLEHLGEALAALRDAARESDA